MGQVLQKNSSVIISLAVESPCEGRERGGWAAGTAASLNFDLLLAGQKQELLVF